MEEITLREVCDRAEVSRRAVQGYEKAGLVCATGKNERGYLLYDTYSLKKTATELAYAEVISYNPKNLEREFQNESRQQNKQQSKTKRKEEEI